MLRRWKGTRHRPLSFLCLDRACFFVKFPFWPFFCLTTDINVNRPPFVLTLGMNMRLVCPYSTHCFVHGLQRRTYSETVSFYGTVSWVQKKTFRPRWRQRGVSPNVNARPVPRNWEQLWRKKIKKKRCRLASAPVREVPFGGGAERGPGRHDDAINTVYYSWRRRAHIRIFFIQTTRLDVPLS